MIKPLDIKNFTKAEDEAVYVSEASTLGLTAGAPHILHVVGMNPNKPGHAYAFNLVKKDETKADYIAQPVPLWQGDNRPKLSIFNT